jgi:hypothetical protein
MPRSPGGVPPHHARPAQPPAPQPWPAHLSPGRTPPPGPGARVVQRALTSAARAGKDGNGEPWDLEGNCGHFRRVYDWTLTGADKGSGVIVQKVDRAFDIYDYGTAKKLTAAEVDTYTKQATMLDGWTQYWEAWTVAKNKTAPLYGDQFLFAGAGDRAVKKTTKGWYSITGSATYHSIPNATVAVLQKALEDAGMNTGASPANGLYVSKADPTTKKDANGVLFIPAGGAAVVNTNKVTWDSAVADPTNKGWWGESTVT